MIVYKKGVFNCKNNFLFRYLCWNLIGQKTPASYWPTFFMEDPVRFWWNMIFEWNHDRLMIFQSNIAFFHWLNTILINCEILSRAILRFRENFVIFDELQSFEWFRMTSVIFDDFEPVFAQKILVVLGRKLTLNTFDLILR